MGGPNEFLEESLPVRSINPVQLFVCLGVWLALFLGFTLAVDPYGVSPLALDIAGVNQSKPRRVDIDRQIKPIEVWLKQPKTLFMGTSRIHQSMNPDVLRETPFWPAYNAAVPAVSFPTNRAYFEYYADINPKMDTAVIEVFALNFLTARTQIAETPARSLVRDFVQLNMSADALWDAGMTLIDNFAGRPDGYRVAKGGHFEYPARHAAAGTFGGFPEGIWRYAPLPPMEYRLSESSLEALRDIVNFASRRGIRLRFVATPNHAFFEYYFDYMGLWPLIEEILFRIAEIAEIDSFSQFNAWTSERPEDPMRYWYDPSHFSAVVGRAILLRLTGEPTADEPANFYMRLKPSDVAAHVAQRRTAIREWGEKNADFRVKLQLAHCRWLKSVGPQQNAATDARCSNWPEPANSPG